MPLSANVLMHMTKDKESLKGIMGSRFFKIKHCRENIEFSISRELCLNVLVPMVSFCDIPLSEIKTHIDKYGSYGIGMTKEWAKRKGLSPVFYIQEGSPLAESYLRVLGDLLDRSKDQLDNAKYIGAYIKSYQGKLERKGETIKECYRFSDEREWRFVPGKEYLNGVGEELLPFVIDRGDEQSQKCIKEAKHVVESVPPLDFCPEDIKYILINDESEIPEIIEHIRSSFGNMPLFSVETLFTKILTSKQIKEDV